MCAEASAILVAVAADFFFDGSHLEVSTDVIECRYRAESSMHCVLQSMMIMWHVDPLLGKDREINSYRELVMTAVIN
jgi:hypothetical protein